MAGRYPFDTTGGGRGHNPLNAAQVRAALGLSTGVEDATAYLQTQQRQQQDLQRDLQLRQLFLQEQLEQHVQEQQLRAIGEKLHDFPDLQQHYQSLLINEQLSRRREQIAQAQLRYEDELRRQQLGFLPQHLDAAAAFVQPNPPAVAAMPAAALRALETRLQQAAGGLEQQAYNLGGIAAETSPEIQASVKRSASMGVDEYDQKPAAKRMQLSPPVDAMDAFRAQTPQNELTGEQTVEDALNKIVVATDLATSPILQKGTVEGLLSAAADTDKMDDAAAIIQKFQDIDWPDSEDEAEETNNKPKYVVKYSSDPAVMISSPRFKSALPCLPEEPLLEDEKTEAPRNDDESALDAKKTKKEGSLLPEEASQEDKVHGTKDNTKKVLAVLDYPVPIDTWWPSQNGMRRERRNAGETSDEDAFEENPSALGEMSLFRANDRKIRSRLAREAEPGLLEKLPHCRLHRVRTRRKKNSTAPEFMYCWQVTEIYPNDTILCCSRCGTWRHATCGGHFEPFLSREYAKKPFKAVCENCHEEEKFLQEFPVGAKRMELQRIELLRRAMATSAVMRQASFSKHGGTYKWPLGSVSGTHIAGHTRSVHARHDKAEKQWADMGQRLNRGFGYRPKERVKSRTKELERLMTSIEDAEAYTERHNMIHFFMRDTARDKPIGYENELVNIFDPEVDELSKGNAKKEPEEPSSPAGVAAAAESDTTYCARAGCSRKPRFDSLFCSDACGLSALQADLLQTMFEASEIHPSVLRP